MLETRRLRLITGTVALAQAELRDREDFARQLGAAVPENWPPETLADALPLFLELLEAAEEGTPWYTWYALQSPDGAGKEILVGSIGFKGAPDATGTVEVGYSVLPQFQGRGYASEMAAALVDWALGQEGVQRVIAETEPGNTGSIGVLRNTGFMPAGTATEPGHIRFERLRPDIASSWGVVAS